MRWGKMVSQGSSWNLGPIWIQPRLDTYHLNFTSEAAEAIWEGGLEKEQVYEFITDGLNWLDTVPLSIPSEYYFDFDLGLQDVSRMRRLPRIEIRDDFVDEDLNVVYNEYAYHDPRPFTNISLSATMAFITIHAKRRHAVASGLFGLLLDAPVQLVDFDDEQNLRSFHALFERDIYNRKRTEVIKLFSLILSPIFRSRVQDWTEKGQVYRPVVATRIGRDRDQILDLLEPPAVGVPPCPDEGGLGFFNGAPDIPDVPPGSASEGDNFLDFLSLLKSRLPKDKSISIAIPASFWYLQAYPVKDMAKYVDYFIYMTYDLHGQWDVDNKWAIPSCEGGNCLRSHVNKTETYNALAMLTKAGVKSTKIAVGGVQGTLQESLLSTFAEVAIDIFKDATVQVPELEAVVAFAMPVLQLAESIDSMKDIKDIGERVMEEKKRELIFKILTFVFMALPFVGEAPGPLVGSATALARIALLVSEAGNAAVTIADIIKDPTSAPFAMLGLIVGAAGGGGKLSKTESLGEASKARGLMKAADLAKFPQRFRDRDALVQKISKKSVCSVI
ncbi:hypothetical protein ACSS6W_007874 [Trichoderma asperelloides]